MRNREWTKQWHAVTRSLLVAPRTSRNGSLRRSGPLARIAYNYRWCWYPGGKDVFRSIDQVRWQLCGENPVHLLQEASSETLARAAGDPEILALAASLEEAFAADVSRPPVETSGAGAADRVPLRRVRRAQIAAHLLGRARRAGR